MLPKVTIGAGAQLLGSLHYSLGLIYMYQKKNLIIQYYLTMFALRPIGYIVILTDRYFGKKTLPYQSCKKRWFRPPQKIKFSFNSEYLRGWCGEVVPVSCGLLQIQILYSSIHFRQSGISLTCDAFPYSHLLLTAELPIYLKGNYKRAFLVVNLKQYFVISVLILFDIAYLWTT